MSSETGSAKKWSRRGRNEDLVRRFVDASRRTRAILPATTGIERLCVDALVGAERRIEARIARPGFGATSSIYSKRRPTPA